METLTTQRARRRCWARCSSAGATALAAAMIIGSAAAGAATTTNTPAPLGASGSVASLSGSSMEVQSPTTGQTTVSWTPTTKFSKTVSEAVSVLTAGDCVTVTGTPSKSSKTIAARSISVAPASTSGSCSGPARSSAGTPTGGAGRVGGPGGGGFNFRTGDNGNARGQRPPFPGGSGTRFGGLGSLTFATGKVTAVIGSTVSVSGFEVKPGSFGRKSGSSKGSKPTTPKTQGLKITTSGSTTVSATQSAASTDLAVGDCVSAFGPAAPNGAVTASDVRITATGSTSCGAGFRGGPQGGTSFGSAGGGSA
jgi:Domain of unknown function (DUF5666)